MLHAEIALGSKREGRDTGHGAEKSFVVAVIGYTVGARGIVIDEAEVVFTVGKYLRDTAECVETLLG